MLKIHKRGDIWHFSGTVAGRRLRGSTGTQDKTTAQRIAAETEARQWQGHLDGPGANLTRHGKATRARRAYAASGRCLKLACASMYGNSRGITQAGMANIWPRHIGCQCHHHQSPETQNARHGMNRAGVAMWIFCTLV